MMLSKHNGARNELIAATWLLSQGYEVFRNVSQHGLVDLIGLKDGMFTSFDVKSSHNQRLSREQVQSGVKRIAVSPDGSCDIDWNPTAREPMEPRPCLQCGTLVYRRRSSQIFCSGGKCGTKYHFSKRSQMT